MSKLFQVSEEDLAQLEHDLPQILEHPATHELHNDPAWRVKFNRIKQIITNIRWNYGPHTNVERIDP